MNLASYLCLCFFFYLHQANGLTQSEKSNSIGVLNTVKTLIKDPSGEWLKNRRPGSSIRVFTNVNKMGIFHCQIPKNGATIMKVIMCDLYRYFKGITFKIKYEKDKSLSDCQLEQWYKSLVATKYKADLWKTNPEETKIAVIRHPLKRFLSLYGYLCEQVNLCGAGTNIQKFTKDVYTLLSTRSVNGTLFKATNQAVLEYHAQPQTWFCNLSTDYQKFHLIHNAGDRLAMRLELQKAFDAANVPKKFSDQVLFHIVYSDTVHANHDQNHTKQLKASMEENPETMAYFNAIYYKDFELLGY